MPCARCAAFWKEAKRMPDAVKPEICLTGKLLYPIHIGLPAYIQETDGYRRTSTVCAILADTQEATVIETRNSVYSIQKV